MQTILIGPRGCGKTSIGRRLAGRCGLRFIDLDDRVLARFAEPTVTEVWARHGEAAWRAAEVEEFGEVIDDDGLILALGGGTPMIDAARAMLVARQKASDRHHPCRVVYLRCSEAELRRRLNRNAGDRPPLDGGDAVAEVTAVLARREPTYLDLADLVFEIGAGDPDAQTARLHEALAAC